MARAHILIVEDDQDINEIVATKLQRCGYDCDQAYSGTEAQLVLGQAGVVGVETTTRTVPFNLMVCDLMLPGLSGETLVQTLRVQHVAIPIVVMSAKSEVSDRIDVLRLGADDYLVKPFDLDELVARAEVQLRHHAGSSLPEHTTAVTYGLWSVDRDARTFFVDGRAIELTRTEFDIIATLVGRPKKVFTKAELFAAVWDEPCAPDDNSVTVHIPNIRAKLRDTGTDSYIKTVWGLGFKLADLANVEGSGPR